MKTPLQATILISLILVSACQQKPLERKYNAQTWWRDVAEGSTNANDSINHVYCILAVKENFFTSKQSENFTYQELINQGVSLMARDYVEKAENSLRNQYEEEAKQHERH